MNDLSLDAEIVMQRFMTKFWPIDYILKFNDLAEHEFPNVFINQSDFI